MNSRLRIASVFFLTIALGCSHALQVKNREMYTVALKLGSADTTKPVVAILPFSGSADSLFYFNALVERLSMDPAIGEVRTDYMAHLAKDAMKKPDLILSVQPNVEYRSSGWNFVINWPGFLIFTPAWNGYVYHADIMTSVVIHDPDGNALDQMSIPVSYNLRHADFDRTVFTGLTWLEVSALALIGGIYNANAFDRDVIAPLQLQVKDNYSNYVLAQVQGRVRSIAKSIDSAEAEPNP